MQTYVGVLTPHAMDLFAKAPRKESQRYAVKNATIQFVSPVANELTLGENVDNLKLTYSLNSGRKSQVLSIVLNVRSLVTNTRAVTI